MKIKLTIKDIIKRKADYAGTAKEYPLVNFSSSGMLIDELAYSAGQYESNDLWEANMDYEPSEPYKYDYEADLLSATKTSEELYTLAEMLKISLNANWERIAKEQKLQAGACVALNNPDQWQSLLEAYTDALKEERTDGISKAYNTAMQEALDSYNDDQYNSWLYGDRDYAGVIAEVAKCYQAEDGHYDKKDHSYTFTFDDDVAKNMLENYNGSKFTKKNLKAYIVSEIYDNSSAIRNKKHAEREKRKAERERQAVYQAQRKAEAEADRKAKLLSRTV